MTRRTAKYGRRAAKSKRSIDELCLARCYDFEIANSNVRLWFDCAYSSKGRPTGSVRHIWDLQACARRTFKMFRPDGHLSSGAACYIIWPLCRMILPDINHRVPTPQAPQDISRSPIQFKHQGEATHPGESRCGHPCGMRKTYEGPLLATLCPPTNLKPGARLFHDRQPLNQSCLAGHITLIQWSKWRTNLQRLLLSLEPCAR